jgi:hypothetical protein
VNLSNVDFTNIEPGGDVLTGTATGTSKIDITFASYGIITSTPANTPSGTTWTFACNYNSDTAVDGPAFCGSSFTWDGGTVTGLNRDITVVDVDESSKIIFYGFMELRYLETVSISNVTFNDNVVPIITRNKNSL